MKSIGDAMGYATIVGIAAACGISVLQHFEVMSLESVFIKQLAIVAAIVLTFCLAWFLADRKSGTRQIVSAATRLWHWKPDMWWWAALLVGGIALTFELGLFFWCITLFIDFLYPGAVFYGDVYTATVWPIGERSISGLMIFEICFSIIIGFAVTFSFILRIKGRDALKEALEMPIFCITEPLPAIIGIIHKTRPITCGFDAVVAFFIALSVSDLWWAPMATFGIGILVGLVHYHIVDMIRERGNTTADQNEAVA